MGVSVGCSSTPPQPARARFLAQLQQPGVHRFDQVQVGTEGKTLGADVATCVANAFERDHWPLEAAVDGKVPSKVDVRMVNADVAACEADPNTTTTGPFG